MLRETSTLACLLLSHSGAGLTALFAPSDRQMLWYIGVPSPFRAIVWRCVCIYINTDTWSWKYVFLSRDAFPTRESIGSAQDGDFSLFGIQPIGGVLLCTNMGCEASHGLSGCHSAHWCAFSFLHKVWRYVSLMGREDLPQF